MNKEMRNKKGFVKIRFCHYLAIFHSLFFISYFLNLYLFAICF